ncbi:hypothetical protein ZOSMA_3G01840 [Zostera marina]|uniref:Dirigent protein n=1 Tax=Zostera marina TaxID=29655 RepID=A0A0K9P693_ZOSMR|nr:hypothetical protein ZOSMA_3G01840 [Zostera marina]
MSKLCPTVIIFLTTLIFFCYASSYDRTCVLESDSLFNEVEESPTRQRSKVYNFRVYWHESFIGSNASSIIIVGANLSQIEPRGFGTAYAFDCPLTLEPKVPTTADDIIGNAQG